MCAGGGKDEQAIAGCEGTVEEERREGGRRRAPRAQGGPTRGEGGWATHPQVDLALLEEIEVADVVRADATVVAWLCWAGAAQAQAAHATLHHPVRLHELAVHEAGAVIFHGASCSDACLRKTRDQGQSARCAQRRLLGSLRWVLRSTGVRKRPGRAQGVDAELSARMREARGSMARQPASALAARRPTGLGAEAAKTDLSLKPPTTERLGVPPPRGRCRWSRGGKP